MVPQMQINDKQTDISKQLLFSLVKLVFSSNVAMSIHLLHRRIFSSSNICSSVKRLTCQSLPRLLHSDRMLNKTFEPDYLDVSKKIKQINEIIIFSLKWIEIYFNFKNQHLKENIYIMLNVEIRKLIILLKNCFCFIFSLSVTYLQSWPK